jgi:hypothetical protein
VEHVLGCALLLDAPCAVYATRGSAAHEQASNGTVERPQAADAQRRELHERLWEAEQQLRALALEKEQLLEQQLQSGMPLLAGASISMEPTPVPVTPEHSSSRLHRQSSLQDNLWAEAANGDTHWGIVTAAEEAGGGATADHDLDRCAWGRCMRQLAAAHAVLVGVT